MAPHPMHRPHTRRFSALALAALSLASAAIPAPAQTGYRDYGGSGFEPFPGDTDDDDAPLRRRPSAEDDDDERFEKDDSDNDYDDYDSDFPDDRQGNLDLSPGRQGPRRAPEPPPSLNAKPDDKAWKPAL